MSDWPDFVEEVAYSLRTQKQKTTGFTPYRLMFAREHRPLDQEELVCDFEEASHLAESGASGCSFEDLVTPPEEDFASLVQDQDHRQQELHKEREKKVGPAQEKQKEEYERRKKKGVKVHDIAAGMEVLKKNVRNESRKGGKMEAKWIGPYKVLDVDANRRVALEKNGKKLETRTPQDQLRPFLKGQLNRDARDLAMLSGVQAPSSQGPSVSSPTPSPTPFITVPRQQQRMATPRDVPLAPAHRAPCEAAREVLQKDKWLDDLHIDHAQFLLGNGFPSISGFQSTVIFDSKNCAHVRSPSSSFVQILNVHSNHWLTVSNIQCQNNTIQVFDSMDSKLETSDKFNCQVAVLLNSQSSAVTVECVKIKQQEGHSDCGLFAIACATSLCFGMSPATQNYVQSEMRSHLAKCFKEGVMQPFPVASPLQISRSNFYTVNLCCKCRKPKFKDNSLIQCLLCQSWYHTSCENIVDSVVFLCHSCKVEIGTM